MKCFDFSHCQFLPLEVEEEAVVAFVSNSLSLSSGNKMAVKRKKKVKSVGPTMIDLDETEREMDILIGQSHHMTLCLMIPFIIIIIIIIIIILEIQQALCNPGPDMIVCDEGHRIKNDSTNISQALKRVKTRLDKLLYHLIPLSPHQTPHSYDRLSVTEQSTGVLVYG